MERFRLVEVFGGQAGRPLVRPWAPTPPEQPGLDTAHRIIGVTVTALAEGQQGSQVAVMWHGFLREISAQVGETWATGDLLWGAPSPPGSITNVRPTAPFPLVLVGMVMGGTDPDLWIQVDVRVLPSLGELSNVLVEDPEEKDVLIYDAGAQVWEPRQLHHGTDLAGLDADDHPQYSMKRWAWMMGD